MFSDPDLSGRLGFRSRQTLLASTLLSGVLASGVLAASGCSAMRPGTHDAALPPAPAASAAQTDATVAPEPQTVTEALGDVPEEPGTTTVINDAGPDLKAGAPKTYVVQRGDTLWHIASLFLRDPLFWPEIWYINPDIHNPHLIYPGDMVRLALRGDGRTSLQVVAGHDGGLTRLEPMLRSSPLEAPIASIPYSVIAAFLSRPGVLSKDEINAAPYVLAIRDDHVVAGTGHQLYVKHLSGEAGARYSVMHLNGLLTDPDSGRKLGYLATYTGTAQLTRPGTIATVTVIDSARETLQGDVLVAAENDSTADLVPHAPSHPTSGRVLAVMDNVLLAGQFNVVALSRGSADGIERGNVLTVEQVAGQANDRCASIEGKSTCWHLKAETLPTESAGTLLVFKTYEHMSFALILSETVPIHVNDHVRNP